MGKIDGKRTRGQQRMRWLDSTTNSVDMNLSKLQEMVKDRGAWYALVHPITKSQTRLGDWTTRANAAMLWEIKFDSKISSIWISPKAKSSSLFNNTKSLMIQGFPGGTVVKNLLLSRRNRFHLWVDKMGRSSGEGNGNPLQYSCLGNFMDRGAW